MVLISAACLVKFSVLPLALIMVVIWIVYIIKNKPEFSISQLNNRTSWVLLFMLIILLGFNFSIYGINIIRYGSLLPSCSDIYSEEICAVSTYAIRHQEMALPEKLSVFAAFRQETRNQFAMFLIIGSEQCQIVSLESWGTKFISHQCFIFSHVDILVNWIGNALYPKTEFPFDQSFQHHHFLCSGPGSDELQLRIGIWFSYISCLAGSIYFPVITIAYVIWAYIIENVSNKLVRATTLLAIIALFFYGGPIRFIWYYHSVFADWFI